MNIHDKARQLVAQSTAPTTLRAMYARLGRRGAAKKNYGSTTVAKGAFANVESSLRNYRSPYNDN